MSSIADDVAERYRDEVRLAIGARGCPRIVLRGILGDADDPASRTYASYTERGCQDVGIAFERVLTTRLCIEEAIRVANEDEGVSGILVYYPVWGGTRDAYIKEIVDHRKDVEGLNSLYAYNLYNDVRTLDGDPRKKSILPCTPLAIRKVLDEVTAVAGKTVTIFNRSEVVGRPLAVMLAHDGAKVYSFDEYGPLLFEGRRTLETDTDRATALAESDIVITGVPSRDFPKVRADEIAAGAHCVNFSTVANFEADIEARAGSFVRRVGPVTVAMCLRNTLRLHDYLGPATR